MSCRSAFVHVIYTIFTDFNYRSIIHTSVNSNKKQHRDNVWKADAFAGS